MLEKVLNRLTILSTRRRFLASAAANFGFFVLFIQVAQGEGLKLRETFLGLTGWILIAIIWSLVTSYIATISSDRAANKIALLTRIRSCQNHLKSIGYNISLFSRNMNYYELILAEWRLEHAKEVIQNLSSHTHKHPVLNDYEYFIMVFNNILNRLDNKDNHYLTISNYEFWNTAYQMAHGQRGLDVTHRDFLETNISAGGRLQKNIKRVILIDENLLKRNIEYQNGLNKILEWIAEKTMNVENAPFMFHITNVQIFQLNHRIVAPLAYIYNDKYNDFLGVIPQWDKHSLRFTSIQFQSDYERHRDHFTNTQRLLNDLLKTNGPYGSCKNIHEMLIFLNQCKDALHNPIREQSDFD